MRTDTTLPRCLANSQRAPLDDDDELPRCLANSQRMRDATHDIHRAAFDAALDSKDTAP